MADLIQFRRDTKERWEAINPVLAEGELGLEIDTRYQKIGDGVHAWNDLKYTTDVAVKEISLKEGTGKMVVQLVKTDGTKEELTIPGATSTTNGVMTATDKLNLDNSLSHIAVIAGTWDATLTFFRNKGNSSNIVLPSATYAKAGIMSAEDKRKVENAVKDVTLATSANSMSLTMTKSGEAASTVVNIPIVTDSVAGIMSAEDKAKLDSLAIKSIDIEDIDTIPASIEDAAVMAIDTSHSRYILTHGNINVGAIDIFSDNLGHQLTEVLTTHYEMTSGDVEPSHSDVEVYTYYRSYNINSFELARKGVARGTWSEWQQCVEELTNEELEKILN